MPVTEVSEILPKKLLPRFRRRIEAAAYLVGRRRIARNECFTVAGHLGDGHATALHLFLGGHDAALLVAVDQVVDARHEGVGVAEAHQREHFRDADLEPEGFAVDRAVGPQYAHGGERRTLLPFVEGLHRGQLHGLHAGHDGSRTVAREGRDQGEDESESRGDGDALAGHPLFAPAQQVPCRDAHDEQRREHERRGDGVEELVDGHGRQRHGRE